MSQHLVSIFASQWTTGRHGHFTVHRFLLIVCLLLPKINIRKKNYLNSVDAGDDEVAVSEGSGVGYKKIGTAIGKWHLIIIFLRLFYKIFRAKQKHFFLLMTLRFNLSVIIISSVNLRIYSSIPYTRVSMGKGGIGLGLTLIRKIFLWWLWVNIKFFIISSKLSTIFMSIQSSFD